jgi:hypothetical protein
MAQKLAAVWWPWSRWQSEITMLHQGCVWLCGLFAPASSRAWIIMPSASTKRRHPGISSITGMIGCPEGKIVHAMVAGQEFVAIKVGPSVNERPDAVEDQLPAKTCQYAIEAGDAIFAPRMKMLLLRAVVLARRRKELADSTRRNLSVQVRVRSRTERDHGAGTHQPPRQATTQTLRQGAQPLIHLPRTS